MMNGVRYFNKHILNKVLRQFVNLPFGPFALVKHSGRKSGKGYETPIMAFPIQGDFMIALTYGPQVDWYQNVLAAGGCKLVCIKKNMSSTASSRLSQRQPYLYFRNPSEQF